LDLQQINKIEGIVGAEIKDLKIIVRTAPIYMGGVLLGSFRIELNPHTDSDEVDDKIAIYNEDTIVTFPKWVIADIENPPIGNGFHHPHIWNFGEQHHTCLGNIEDGVLFLLKEHEYVPLITILLEFLRNGYGWEGVEEGEFLSYWEKQIRC
jgi:hypothetical protein